jgi:hypothetical protein
LLSRSPFSYIFPLKSSSQPPENGWLPGRSWGGYVRNAFIKATAGGFAAALVGATIVVPPASAAANGAVPFSQAKFSGYATGTELHLGVTALNAVSQVTGVQLNSLDQADSAATTSSSGLTSAITSELGTVIQPAQPAAIKAFDSGAGLSLNLGQVGQTVSSLASTILGAVKTAVPAAVVATAPPNVPGVSDQLGPINLDPVGDFNNLVGEAQANFPQASCPASDISYGLGNLTAANILTGLPSLTASGVNTAPLISTTGDGTSVSQSKSVTLLHPNGDGTFGIQTQASDIIAPITVNLLGLATLQIAVKSAGGVSDPVTLTSTTTGEGSGASVVPSTDDILNVVLTPAGQKPVTLANVPLSTLVGTSGLHIPISITGLTQLLSQVSVPSIVIQTLQNVITGLSQVSNNSTVQSVINTINTVIGTLKQVTDPVTNVLSTITNEPTVQQLLAVLNGVLTLNLGSIDVDMTPHAIGQAWNVPATVVGGTQAGGAMDLLNIKLGLANSSINIGGQTIPANTIPGVSQAISVPTIGTVPLPDIPLANFVAGHLEAQSVQQQPIECATSSPEQAPPTTTPPASAPKNLPFTGGPSGLWQPVAGVGTLGLGGFSLALVRRLRKRSAA